MFQYQSSTNSRSCPSARVDHQRQTIHAMRHKPQPITPTQFQHVHFFLFFHSRISPTSSPTFSIYVMYLPQTL
ncbi:hypothetical protein V8C34DRAFT_275614 [Trichoderma compactum]